MEIPKEIKYELLLIFGGLSPTIFAIWLFVFHQDKLNIIMGNPAGAIVSFLFVSVGVFFFLVGFYEVTDNYYMNKSLVKRNYILERYKIDTKLKKLPKEYLSNIAFPEKKDKN